MAKRFRDGADDFVAGQGHLDDVVVAVTGHAVPVVITRKTFAPVGVVVPVRTVGAVVKVHEGVDCTSRTTRTTQAREENKRRRRRRRSVHFLGLWRGCLW